MDGPGQPSWEYDGCPCCIAVWRPAPAGSVSRCCSRVSAHSKRERDEGLGLAVPSLGLGRVPRPSPGQALAGEPGPGEERLLPLDGFLQVAVAQNQHDHWPDAPVSSKGQAVGVVAVPPVSNTGKLLSPLAPYPHSDGSPDHPKTNTIRLPFRQHDGIPSLNNVSHRHPAPAVVPRTTGILHLCNPETTIVSGERHATKEPGAPAADRVAPDLLIAFQTDPQAYREDNAYVISAQMCPRSVGRHWRTVRHGRSGPGYRLWRMAWKVIYSDSLSRTTHLTRNPIGWDMPWTTHACGWNQ